MSAFRLSLTALFLCSAASPLLADSIPYAAVGTVAAQLTTTAKGSGGLDLYYLGSTAGYTDYVGVYDLQTGSNSGLLFNNRTTAVGTEAVVGSAPGQIAAGDQLIFYIDSPEGIFTSLADYNTDQTNHAYVTRFSGGTVNGVQIPSGLFVGMEDEAASHSDLNYNDLDFVVTNTSSSVTPEPSSFLLLGTGAFGLMVNLFRRRSGREAPND